MKGPEIKKALKEKFGNYVFKVTTRKKPIPTVFVSTDLARSQEDREEICSFVKELVGRRTFVLVAPLKSGGGK